MTFMLQYAYIGNEILILSTPGLPAPLWIYLGKFFPYSSFGFSIDLEANTFW